MSFFVLFLATHSRCLGTKTLKRDFQAVIMKDVLCRVPNVTVCRKLIMSLVHREGFFFLVLINDTVSKLHIISLSLRKHKLFLMTSY